MILLDSKKIDFLNNESMRQSFQLAFWKLTWKRLTISNNAISRPAETDNIQFSIYIPPMAAFYNCNDECAYGHVRATIFSCAYA